MIIRLLLVISLLLPTVVLAERTRFLRGPNFNWNNIQTITTQKTLVGGLKMIRIEHVPTGCILLIIENTDLIMNDKTKCDKYINERTHR